MRTRRTWLIVGAVVAALVLTVLLTLPIGVRVLAERQVRDLTGRPVTIADVDLNLFTRRLVVTGLRVHAGDGEPAPLTLARLSARPRWWPLLRGRIELERLALVEPRVHVARTGPARFNVSDILERLAARPAGAPMQVAVDTLVVSGGRAQLDDRAVDPDRSWVLADLALEAHDLVTVADATRGRASATFVLAGAPGTLEVAGLGLRPPQARLALTLDGLDLAGLAAYLPADAAVRLSDGRLGAHLALDWDAAAGALGVGGDVTLAGLALARAGQEPPLLAVPSASLAARGLRYTGGAIVAGEIELAADRLTVLDATAPRPRPLDVTALRAGWKAAADASRAAGALTLGAELPEGGRLTAQGTADPLAPTAALEVDLRGLDVGLVRAWIPAGAAVEPVAGRLAGTLALTYADAAVVVGGRLRLRGLEVARAGQQAPLVRDEQILATLDDVTFRGGRLAPGRIEITGSPTVTDASVTPPQRLHLPRLSLVAQGGAVPGGDPVRLRADATLPRGGRLEAEGTGTLGPAGLSLTVRAADADLAVAAPYLPPDSPIALGQGRLDGSLTVTWAGTLASEGSLVARDLTLLRRGQARPFIHHPTLEARISGLALRDGQLTVERVTLAGAPTVVDATATPPQRFVAQQATLDVADFTWPGQRPARVEGSLVMADGGRGELSGTLHPGTLAADVRSRFEGVDVMQAAGYVPPGTPLVIEGGRAAMTVRLRHRRADGVRLEAEGAVDDVALRLTAGPGLRLHDPRIAFSVTDLVVHDGATALGAATVEGTPALAREGAALPPPIALRAELGGLRWPGGAPAPWRVVAEPPGGGRLTAEGTLASEPWRVAGAVQAEDAALDGLAALLPLQGALAGRLDARLRAQAGGDGPVVVEGDLAVRQARVGPADAAPVRAEGIEAEGLALQGRELTVARLVVVQPRVVVERAEDGSFPLRALLGLAPSPAASAALADPAAARPAGAEDAPAGEAAAPVRLRLGELVVREGSARFIDRGTTPFYSEELSRLQVAVSDLTTAGDGRATLALQGTVGVEAALDLTGEIAPFGDPFFLDVRGELRDFSVPRTNPLLQRFLDWIARRGELTTRVHYRIVGDELTATNELTVLRLDVERARRDDDAGRLIGIPLGLAVALLKDARGEIHFTVPVSGELGSPQFSFGDAVRTALKNVLGRLVTAPFRAIGSVFRRDEGTVEEVAVDPVGFAPGSATLTPEATDHLQRVADFLRASPYVRLTLQPVVGAEDLAALQAQQVTERIERVGRAHGIEDFARAARRLWGDARPGTEPPADPQAIVRALAEREPVPVGAAQGLAEQRASVTRRHLTETAGIPRERLLDDHARVTRDGAGGGRVEFGLRPAS